jgi:DNA-binding response OmpR family regulator
MKDGKVAGDYLEGEPPYDDRRLYPMPPLVILDVRMPKRSGLELLAWMRSRPDLAQLPVYMLTSSTLEFDRAMSMGATDYFTKPMSFDGLIDVIRNITIRWWYFDQARAFQSRR